MGSPAAEPCCPRGDPASTSPRCCWWPPTRTGQPNWRCAAPSCPNPTCTMTLAVMRAFGIQVEAAPALNAFRIPRGSYQARTYASRGRRHQRQLFLRRSRRDRRHGDGDQCARSPCRATRTWSNAWNAWAAGDASGQGITVTGPGNCAASRWTWATARMWPPPWRWCRPGPKGRTVIDNIAHLRIKECDRLSTPWPPNCANSG